MAKSQIGSSLVVALEYAWDQIRERHPDIPPAVVTIGRGLDTGGGMTWGSYGDRVWDRRVPEQCPPNCKKHTRHHPDALVRLAGDGRQMPELFVSGERLATGAEATLNTMLHEAAHALAYVRGIQDVTRGRYHNLQFLDLANETGLYHPFERDRALGFNDVVLKPVTKARYRDLLTVLDSRIIAMMSTLAEVDEWVQSGAEQVKA